jgi:hypothetical protein
MTLNTLIIRDGYQIQIDIVTIFFVMLFRAHMNILFNIEVKAPILL